MENKIFDLYYSEKFLKMMNGVVGGKVPYYIIDGTEEYYPVTEATEIGIKPTSLWPDLRHIGRGTFHHMSDSFQRFDYLNDKLYGRFPFN